MSQRAWLAVAAVLAVACSSDVELVAVCELRSGPFRVDTPDPGDGVLLYPSPGILGDDVLMSWTAFGPRNSRGSVTEARVGARWFSVDGAPVSETLDLGCTFDSFLTRWVPAPSGLRGQVWSIPDCTSATQPLDIDQEDSVHLWTMTPAASDARRVQLDVVGRHPSATRQIMIFGGGLASREALPLSLKSDGAAMSALVAIPDACPMQNSNFNRAIVGVESESHPVSHPAIHCDQPASTEDTASNPWLAGAVGDDVGLLFRFGGATSTRGGALFYATVSDDGTARNLRRVGPGVGPNDSLGNQPRAVTVPGGRVLFTDAEGSARCFKLRVMSADGTEASDAPWQLPCQEREGLVTADVDLAPAPTGAVLIWSEHVRVTDVINRGEPSYREGVYAAFLLPDGRRGSDVVRVTDSDATTLVFPEGYDYTRPGEFLPTAGADGESVVVAWTDQRVGAAGFYASVLSCRRVD